MINNCFGFLIFSNIFLLVVLINETSAGGFNRNVDNEGLYKLIGVSKTATTKEIRIAFKKLALEKHPDKNQDDPNANEQFIKINRAYEILKDEDLRKKYDMYGEDGLKDAGNQGNHYQSWNFYKQNFGIYDDDLEIITLSRADFMQTVESNKDTIWFINFYSTQCSHCHDLAPTWRELAKQLDKVVRIGAVNCMDDWMLCNQQQIQAFPSLIMYPKREKFYEEKSLENLLKFALSFASGKAREIKSLEEYGAELSKHSEKPWLINYCISTGFDDEADEGELNYELNCLDDLVKQKLAIMLHGLAKVGSIECNNAEVNKEICSKLKPKRTAPLVFYEKLPNIFEANFEIKNEKQIMTGDYKQIVQTVLNYLPKIKELDEIEFKTVLNTLRDKKKNERPWLVQFVNADTSTDLELKRLPSLLGKDFNFGQLDCSKLVDPNECASRFQIVKYPTFILFKSAASIIDSMSFNENTYEIYYNQRQTPQDLSAFVKENADSRVQTWTEFDLNSFSQKLAAENKLGYFVDFFAPWCPPCMNLLPEFKKAAKIESTQSVGFATIDCTMNKHLCEQFNVRSYPTTILFNQTTPFNYFGHHSAPDIADFIEDILKPSVITLSYESFHKLVGKKPVGKLWLVDFYASWCGPCQQLAPEWRKLAKKIDSNLGFVGQVDCVVEQRLCQEQGVQSYPNIRVYAADKFGAAQFHVYQGWMRDVNSLFQWASEFLPRKTQTLDYHTFESLVLKDEENSEQPWLVDFYAPWCGYCNIFAPKFEIIAAKLEGKVKCGKVNCQENQYLCQRIGIHAYPSILFYPIPDSEFVNWNSGENIQQYEVDSIVYLINSKLESNSYNKNKNYRKIEL